MNYTIKVQTKKRPTELVFSYGLNVPQGWYPSAIRELQLPKQAGEARMRDGERILIFAVCTRIGYNLNCNISKVMQLFHLDAAFRFLLHFVSQLSSSAIIGH